MLRAALGCPYPSRRSSLLAAHEPQTAVQMGGGRRSKGEAVARRGLSASPGRSTEAREACCPPVPAVSGGVSHRCPHTGRDRADSSEESGGPAAWNLSACARRARESGCPTTGGLRPKWRWTPFSMHTTRPSVGLRPGLVTCFQSCRRCGGKASRGKCRPSGRSSARGVLCRRARHP